MYSSDNENTNCHNITECMLTTWALLSAWLWLRPRPHTAVVAVICAGLPLVGELPGLPPSHVSVRHHHHQGPFLLLLVFTPLALLLLPLLKLLPLYGQCCLYWAGAEHGEVCQAAILVHQSEDILEVTIREDSCMKTHHLSICISILMRTVSVFFYDFIHLMLYLGAFFSWIFELISKNHWVAVPQYWKLAQSEFKWRCFDYIFSLLRTLLVSLCLLLQLHSSPLTPPFVISFWSFNFIKI